MDPSQCEWGAVLGQRLYECPVAAGAVSRGDPVSQQPCEGFGLLRSSAGSGLLGRFCPFGQFHQSAGSAADAVWTHFGFLLSLFLPAIVPGCLELPGVL